MYRHMTTADMPSDLSCNHNVHLRRNPRINTQASSGLPQGEHSPGFSRHNHAARESIYSATETASSSMTELVLTKHSPDAERLLLPMLAHLSRDSERWVTWIYDTPVDRQHLNRYGVDTRKIRFIHSDSDECTRWILWEALTTGTSHTVIATLNDLNEEQLGLLEKAADQGCSHGLLIRYR